MKQLGETELIARIYEAAFDDSAWEQVLDAVAEQQKGVAAIHTFDLTAGNGVGRGSKSFPPQALPEYEAHYSRVNPWMRSPRRSFRPGELVLSSAVYPDELLVKGEFYTGFLLPNDLFYSMGGVLVKNSHTVVSVTNLRPRRRGMYSKSEQRAFQRLVPHLQRSLQLARRLGRLAGTLDAMSGVLDRLPYGVLLLEGSGRLVHANRLAHEMLEARDGFQLGGAGVTASRSNETVQLRRLIAEAAKRKGVGAPLALPRPSALRPYTVLVTPLPPPAVPRPGQPAVALFVTDPEHHTEAPHEILARVYGLTPAEERLVRALLHGDRLHDAAERFGVSRNTVRSQLRSVLEKTGTKRQSDLVRLLLSLPSAARGQPDAREPGA